MKRPVHRSDERRVVSRYWRRFQRANIISRVKRQMRRRERHEGRKELDDEG